MTLEHMPIAVVLFIISIIVSVVVTASNTQWVKDTAKLTFLLALALITYRSYNGFYGKPKTLVTADLAEVTIHSFYVTKDKKHLYLWMRKKTDKEPQSYKTVYNKEVVDKLKQQRAKAKGHPFKGKFKSKKKSNTKGINPFGSDLKLEYKKTQPILPPKP